MRLLASIFAGSLLCLNLGCATLYNSDPQTVQLQASDEQPVHVQISVAAGTYPAQLPLTVQAPSHAEGIRVQIRDACYEPGVAEVPRKITSSYWANIFFGAGLIVDAITGRMWKYEPSLKIPVQKKPDCASSRPDCPEGGCGAHGMKPGKPDCPEGGCGAHGMKHGKPDCPEGGCGAHGMKPGKPGMPGSSAESCHPARSGMPGKPDCPEGGCGAHGMKPGKPDCPEGGCGAHGMKPGKLL